MSTTLHIDGNPVILTEVVKKPQEISFVLDGKRFHFRSARLPDGSWLLEQEVSPGTWRRTHGTIWQAGKDARRVQLVGLEAKIAEPRTESTGSVASALSPTAPMPGLIRQVMVKVGERVKLGQSLVVMEAMKLQITLAAGGDGTVKSVPVKVGDMVAEGAELVVVEAATKKSA